MEASRGAERPVWSGALAVSTLPPLGKQAAEVSGQVDLPGGFDCGTAPLGLQACNAFSPHTQQELRLRVTTARGAESAGASAERASPLQISWVLMPVLPCWARAPTLQLSPALQLSFPKLRGAEHSASSLRSQHLGSPEGGQLRVSGWPRVGLSNPPYNHHKARRRRRRNCWGNW